MMRICTGFAIGCGAFLMMSWAPADEKAKPFQNTKEEVTLTELTNAERKKDEKSGLVLNPALSKIARAHAENMARQGKMEHKLDDKNVFDRIKDARYEYRFAGENLAFGDKGIQLTAIMKLWMASESHRKNILFPEFTQIGIGIARAKNGDLYFTQVFAKPAE
jgi:uncharacterized protein YkwD